MNFTSPPLRILLPLNGAYEAGLERYSPPQDNRLFLNGKPVSFAGIFRPAGGEFCYDFRADGHNIPGRNGRKRNPG